MREIMLKTGYYDAQWRKYESGGSLNIASLMKVALALDVTLVELLDGLGQWPRLSVNEIENKHGIEPTKVSELESKVESEPGTPANQRRKARSTPNRATPKTLSATADTAALKKTSKSAHTSSKIDNHAE